MNERNFTTETLIVGGGLCGLALADHLARAGQEFLLVEGRDRLGGRVSSQTVEGSAFDLGPAWFWPGQPRMAALAQRFDETVFEQYSLGKARFETPDGIVHEAVGIGSMQGSLRVSGGLSTLTNALARTLPQAHVLTGTSVTALQHAGEGITATLEDGRQISARRVVLAMPPRLAAGISFKPELPPETQHALHNIPTWMAGHAKAVLLYDTPFWRDAGLSGDAISQRGPLAEIHDASPMEDGMGALFGFVGVGPAHRQDAGALQQAIISQVARLFGPAAPNPREVILKDWAFDPLTATQSDHTPLRAHPAYGRPPALTAQWSGSLIFSGTELAPTTGGFLEGALEAADAAANELGVRV